MFLKDPVLRRIAAATGDVWPDRMWRFDTVETGAPGEIAKLLHDTSLRFTESLTQLLRVLAKTRHNLTRIVTGLASHAHLHHLGTDQLMTDLVTATVRHAMLEQQLLHQYAAWRHDAGSPQLHGHFHLLVKAGDPSWGVITLQSTTADTLT